MTAEPGLPPYLRTMLGAEEAARVLALRKELREAGLGLPAWIDRRPGLLEVVVGDVAADPPLSRSARTLALTQGHALISGLLVFKRAAAARRAALLVRDQDAADELRRMCRELPIEIVLAPRAWPAMPEVDVPDAAGRALVLPAERLDAASCALAGRPPHRLCTVAGEVARPQVVDLKAGQTPLDLLRACGGARRAAWVPVVWCPPDGPRIIEADAALPAGCPLLLVLPAAHELVRRLRAPQAEWLRQAASACQGCRMCTDACPELSGSAVGPHHLIGLLVRGARGAEDARALRAAQRCTACAVCDAICPAGLSPWQIVEGIRRRLPEPPAGPARDDLPRRPPAVSAERRLPLPLLIARLGLSAYAAP